MWVDKTVIEGGERDSEARYSSYKSRLGDYGETFVGLCLEDNNYFAAPE
jgi:hypothetical protein